VDHRLDVAALHEGVVFVPQQVLEQDLETEGEPGGVAAEISQAIDGVRLAVDGERRAAAK
jgi:hypothetical protein